MSLKASQEGIEKATKALQRKGLTQQLFAEQLEIARSTCSRFFNGKPVSRSIFTEICFRLNLDWQEIFENPLISQEESELGNQSQSLEEQKHSVQERKQEETKPFIPQVGIPFQAPRSYVERPPIEENCYQAIMEPGALLRIKAPAKMGKTLLLERILDYASQQSYQTVKLDFQLADRGVLADFKTFLQWFCVSVADSLDLEDKLDEYWRDIYGLNKNCTRYFQKYLLSVTDSPLVLALDNFERLFAKQEIFAEFCLLLRGWYETAKQGTRVGQLWKKLRLIVVYSTDDYPKLNTNHSPFNVGVLIELPEFTQQQVTELTQLYELELDSQGVNSLIALVGGNPYLVTRALDCLKNQSLSLSELLKQAPTEAGIYSDRLRQLLWSLQQNPHLKAAFEQVVTSSNPIMLDTETGFKLKSMGLVKLSGDGYLTNYDLYRQYFARHLKYVPAGGGKSG